MLEVLTGTGLATAAGLGAFLPMLALGLLDRFTDLVTLPSEWAWLASDVSLIIVAVLAILDFVADKIPAVDSVNDAIQTVIRPAAGGIVFGAGSGSETTQVGDPAQFFNAQVWVPVLIGALIALVTHLTKTSTRLASHAVSAGVAGPVLSSGEDAVSVGLIAAAVLAPIVVVVIVGVLIVLAVSLARWFKSARARRKAAQTLQSADA